MRQFEKVERRSRPCGRGAACLLAGAVTACVPGGVPRGAHDAADAVLDGSVRDGSVVDGSVLDGSVLDDAGIFLAHHQDARLVLDDAPRVPDDARMERPDFTVESATDRMEVHAGGRTTLPLRLVRTGGHRAWIELRVSGLPAHVSGFFAMSPEADHVALVIEASDQASLVSLQPFTLEANGEGLRRTRRMALTVLPEKSEE